MKLVIELVIAILAAIGVYMLYKTYEQEIKEYAKRTHTRLTGAYFKVTKVDGPWVFGKLFGRKTDGTKVLVQESKKMKASEYQQAFKKNAVTGDEGFTELLAMEA